MKLYYISFLDRDESGYRVLYYNRDRNLIYLTSQRWAVIEARDRQSGQIHPWPANYPEPVMTGREHGYAEIPEDNDLPLRNP